MLVSDGVSLSEGDEVVIKVSDINRPPRSVPGEAFSTVAGARVDLNGSRSTDPDGDALSYTWVQTGGPAVALEDADTAFPFFTAPLQTITLSFELVVNDGRVDSDAEDIRVTIIAPEEGCSCTIKPRERGGSAPLLASALFLLTMVVRRRSTKK